MAPVSALETLDLAYLHSERLLRYFTTSLGRSVHGEQSRVVGRPTYWYTLTEHTRVRCCTHSALGGTLSLLCHSNLFSCASSSLCRTAHHSTHCTSHTCTQPHTTPHTPTHHYLTQAPHPHTHPHITTSFPVTSSYSSRLLTLTFFSSFLKPGGGSYMKLRGWAFPSSSLRGTVHVT